MGEMLIVGETNCEAGGIFVDAGDRVGETEIVGVAVAVTGIGILLQLFVSLAIIGANWKSREDEEVKFAP